MIARVLERKAQPSGTGALILPWLRATSIGWTVGFMLILILIAVSTVIGLGETQFAIGLGMGAGVGLLQAPIITAIQGNGRRWFIASAIGIATPFVVSDALRLTTINMRYSLPVLIACGGIVVGLLQWRLLRTRARNSAWWIIASVLGLGKRRVDGTRERSIVTADPGNSGSVAVYRRDPDGWFAPWRDRWVHAVPYRRTGLDQNMNVRCLVANESTGNERRHPRV